MRRLGAALDFKRFGAAVSIMSYDVQDTIAAIATAPTGAARGIVRVSGPACLDVVRRCFRGPVLEGIFLPTALAGTASLGEPFGDVPCTLFYWPTTRSYTRQISAEFHTIGSPPLLAALLARLCRQGARLARPGEFTLRAFLAARLDLTQAEAVLGVIEARGQSDLEAALAQLAGGLAKPLAQLRGELIDLLADLEAGLDFVEEDIQFVERADLLSRLQAAQRQIEAIDEKLQSRDGGGEAPRVVLVGEPNAGKSSLFNALAGAERAIVSPIAGTTRDYLAAQVVCEGADAVLLDTAGMQEGEFALAQAMTRRESEAAQLILFCLDATRPLTPREQQWLAEYESQARRIVVWTKIDAVPRDWRPPRETSAVGIATSSATGAGLRKLRAAIAGELSKTAFAGVAVGTAQRCQESISHAADSLARASDVVRHSGGDELVAAELRLALSELSQVAGAVYTDDVLDRIFSRFCIGK